MIKILRGIAYIWFALVGFSVVISIGWMAYSRPFSVFYEWLTTTFSPFNIANFLVILVLLFPGLALQWLANWLEKRERR